MAISAASAAVALSLSTASRSGRPTISSSSSSVTSLASSSSLFFTESIINRAGLGLVVKARRGVRYGGDSRRKRGMSCNCLFGLGVPELAVIAGVVVLVFGPKKLPEVGRSFGKTLKGFQQAAKEFETELRKDPEAAEEAEPPAEKAVAETGEEKLKAVAVAEEKQDVAVSSTKES